MESEFVRLQRLYAELGDDHLKDLAEDADDLTDEGRMALSAEMQKRGFAPAAHHTSSFDPDRDVSAQVTEAPELESGFGPGIPGVMPSGAAAMEQAMPSAGEQRLGWIKLISLYDGHELTLACQHLENSDVQFAIEEIGHDAMSGAPPSFEIWVEAADLDLGQRVLREKLGFFPLPEVDDSLAQHADEQPTDGHSAILGSFSTRAEADEVATLLGNAGIPHEVAGPETIEGEEWYSIHVSPADLDRGLETVSSGLGMTSAAE